MNKLKNFLSVYDYMITTRLSQADVLAKLASTIEPKKNVGISLFQVRTTKSYIGKIEGTHFRMFRVIHYRNSFIPIIKGNVSSSGNETIVSIKMRLPVVVLIFTLLWLGFFGLISLAMLIGLKQNFKAAVQGGYKTAIVILAPSVIFIVGCLISILRYKKQVRDTKEFFIDLLKGEEKF